MAPRQKRGNIAPVLGEELLFLTGATVEIVSTGSWKLNCIS